MKFILIAFITLLSFFCQSQENQSKIKEIQDKITQFEKLGNIKSKDYKIAVNDLTILYFKSGNLSETELLLKNSLFLFKL